MDELLENEKIKNKTEPWNKLNRTLRVQKLHEFAERYGQDQRLSDLEVENLKRFFNECLEKNKLTKAKDVAYNKDTQEVQSVPALTFNPDKARYTLRILDSKRISTLKSLTPKRITTD
jgi:hypothetical protein